MYKEDLTERDIPYEILEQHGLTHEMLEVSILGFRTTFTPLPVLFSAIREGYCQLPMSVFIVIGRSGVNSP